MPKTCFVICAIGSEGSDVRTRADKVLKHVIRPAAKGCGYTVIRSDEEGQPNQITIDVIRHLKNDPVVVADLTHANPNVYYELGVRHCFRMPAVQIIQKGERLPFDLGSQRTIPLDLTDPDSLEECKTDLAEQINYAVANMEKITTPVSVAVDVEAALATGDPSASLAEAVLEELQAIRSRVTYLYDLEVQRTGTVNWGALSDIIASRGSLSSPPDMEALRRLLRDHPVAQTEEPEAEQNEEGSG